MPLLPGWNNGIAPSYKEPTSKEKIEDAVQSVICDLYQKITVRSGSEWQKEVSEAKQSNRNLYGLKEKEMKEFDRLMDDIAKNPRNYDINCSPGERSITKVGGKRKTRKARKHMKKRKQTRGKRRY